MLLLVSPKGSHGIQERLPVDQSRSITFGKDKVGTGDTTTIGKLTQVSHCGLEKRVGGGGLSRTSKPLHRLTSVLILIMVKDRSPTRCLWAARYVRCSFPVESAPRQPVNLHRFKDTATIQK